MRYVLFVCTHNAGRSQMAQAFFERHAPPDLRAESAGQAPAEAIWPNVIEAMREVGIDLSGRRPKKIELEMQLHADKAITLNCQDTCPYVIGGVEDWDVDDPAGQPLEKVREIRDEIERRVLALLEHADEIRSRPQRARAPPRATAAATGRGVRGHEAGGRDSRLRRRDPERVRRLPGPVVRADAGRAPRPRLPPRARLQRARRLTGAGGRP